MIKKLFILTIGLVFSSALLAQAVQENEMAIVYSMPYTIIRLHLTVQETTRQPGPFYQYADRYLGTKEVVTASEHSYQLTSVKILVNTIADTSRTFKVPAQAGWQTQLLSLTDRGIIYGYNVSRSATKRQAVEDPIAPKTEPETPLMPLLEEQMLAASTAKMAEGAAKQIYRLRETRLNILAGEVEHAPADGAAMERVMAELDKQEQALTRLFTGTITSSVSTKIVTIHPQPADKPIVACRFSDKVGLVDRDNLSGDPVYLYIHALPQQYASTPLLEEVARPTARPKKEPQPSPIVYNIPGYADVKVQFLRQELDSAHIAIPQWGITIPLTQDLFQTNPLPKILWNTQTGNIISIHQ